LSGQQNPTKREERPNDKTEASLFLWEAKEVVWKKKIQNTGYLVKTVMGVTLPRLERR